MSRLLIPLRIGLAVAVLALLAAPGPADARKPAFFCKSAPGDSYVSWRDDSRAIRVDLGWGDADGNPVAQQTLITSEQRQSTFKTAVEFAVAYYDATGVYAVGGMVCQ